MTSSALATSTGRSASYIQEHDAILEVMNRYNEGVRTGNSVLAKSAFHEAATFYGYYNGSLLAGSIQMLFDWIDGNGPAQNIQTRVGGIDILDTIAVVRMELENMTGKLAGDSPSTLSDLFQLIKIDGKWMISQKSFHWHTT